MSFPTFGDVIAVRNAPFLKVFTLLRPVEGRFTPVSATNSRLSPFCSQTQTPAHPQYCAEEAEKERVYSAPASVRRAMGGLIPRCDCAHSLARAATRWRSRQTAERGTSWRGDHLPIAGRRREAGIAILLRRAARDGPAVGLHILAPHHRPCPTCNGWRPGPRLRPGRQRRTRTETERLVTDPDSGLWPTSARSRGPD